MPESLLYTKKDHIGRVVLNRPEAGNAINQELAQELADACLKINQDDDVYVVILTGAGEKSFCKGSETEGPGINCAASVAKIDRPVIAAINGDATGHGLEIALSCDIRLAASGAHFAMPQITGGRLPAGGGTQRLPRIIGKGKALEMILTGETINAEEALKIGLVSQVVSQSELSTKAESLAQSIATKAPISLRFIKEAVNKGLDLTLDQGLRLEADLYLLLHTTDDRTEGIKAFLEKRQPKFKGK